MPAQQYILHHIYSRELDNDQLEIIRNFLNIHGANASSGDPVEVPSDFVIQTAEEFHEHHPDATGSDYSAMTISAIPDPVVAGQFIWDFQPIDPAAVAALGELKFTIDPVSQTVTDLKTGKTTDLTEFMEQLDSK